MISEGAKKHGTDFVKQLTAVSLAIGVIGAMMKMGMCAVPWQAKDVADAQHRAIAEQERIQREAAQMIDEKERARIRADVKDDFADVKEDIGEIKKQVQRLYQWGYQDRARKGR